MSSVELQQEITGGMKLKEDQSERAWDAFREMRSESEEKKSIPPRRVGFLAKEMERQREKAKRDFGIEDRAVFGGSDIKAVLIDTPEEFCRGRVFPPGAMEYFRRYCPVKDEFESFRDFIVRKTQWQQDHSIDLPELESISFSSSVKPGEKSTGKLSCALFEESLVDTLNRGGQSLLLIAASEIGKVSICVIPQIRVTSWEWGISNDCTMSREVYSFESDRVVPWTLIS